MDLTRPATALCQPTMAATLEVLSGADATFTGREIARISGSSVQTTLATLHRLVEHGLVFRQVIGRTHQYRLNRDHLAAQAVTVLASLHTDLLEKLRGAFEGWDPPARHASLFGSAARRDGDTNSDLDILLVRRRGVAETNTQWRDQVEELGRRALAWTGNRVSWVELSTAELDEAVRAKQPLVDEWRHDAVRLVGMSFRALTRTRP